MTTITCGNCKQSHSTPAQVKMCYGNSGRLTEANLPFVERTHDGFPRTEREQLDVVANLPTMRQLGFIQKLLAERPSVSATQPRTKKQASELIEMLLTRPAEKQESTRGASVTDLLDGISDGYFAIPSKTGNNDLDFVVVNTSTGRMNPKAKGKRYVNRFLGGQGTIRIEYAEQRIFAKLLAELSPQQQLEAQVRFGLEVGRCGCCGRSLTDETSRARGIGPDCWGRLGG